MKTIDEVLPENVICYKCENYLLESTCLAFPNGIPEEIIKAKAGHDEVRDDQEGEFLFNKTDTEIE